MATKLTRSRRTRASTTPRRTTKRIWFWQRWSTKKRAAVVRALKIGAYYIFGYVLAVAAFFVVYLLTDKAVDQVIVQITGFIVASITGGIHKAINWQAVGIDPSTLPAPTVDASLPMQVAIPQTSQSSKNEGGN